MLSAHELEQIKVAINYTDLQEMVADELLDHQATCIEVIMLNGNSFDSAMNSAFQILPNTTIDNINYNYKRMKLMKKLKRTSPIAATFVVLAIAISTQLISQEEKWQLPITQDEITVMSSGFGPRNHPIHKTNKVHTGMDFVAPLGTPVKAVKTGVIIETAKDAKGYGNYIIITHTDGSQSLYGQLNEIKVAINDSVKGGDTIGTVGSSGASTGPHLHFEMIKDGKKVNPLSLDPIFKLEENEDN